LENLKLDPAIRFQILLPEHEKFEIWEEQKRVRFEATTAAAKNGNLVNVESALDMNPSLAATNTAPAATTAVATNALRKDTGTAAAPIEVESAAVPPTATTQRIKKRKSAMISQDRILVANGINQLTVALAGLATVMSQAIAKKMEIAPVPATAPISPVSAKQQKIETMIQHIALLRNARANPELILKAEAKLRKETEDFAVTVFSP